MHTESNATEDLVLTELPNGQAAWLRPYQWNPARVVIVDQVDVDAPIPFRLTVRARQAIHSEERS